MQVSKNQITSFMSHKEIIYKICKKKIQNKLDSINDRLADIAQSLAAETKSSVGDKYETTRAMLHLEKDKIMFQLANLIDSKKLLQTINPQKKYTKAQLGALVYSNQAIYFLGISLGKIQVENQTIFCISTLSPIGNLLLQKEKGDTILFRNKSIKITAIY